MPRREDDRGGDDNDNARVRKRERDKENQRQKRGREKDVLRDLERRNASLEQQVKALSNAASGSVQDLSDSIRLLKTTNEVLERRLGKVDTFVKSWLTPGQPDDQHAEPPPENQEICVDANTQDSGRRETVREGCGDIIQANKRHAQPHVQLPRIQNSPLLLTHGPAEQAICLENLQDILALPPWQRLPAHCEVQECFDPFGQVITRLRSSADDFQKCPAEPNPIDLFRSISQNELANAVFRSTSLHPLRLGEKVAINSINYQIARVCSLLVLNC